MASTQPLPAIRTSPLRVLRRVSETPRVTALPPDAVLDIAFDPIVASPEIRPFAFVDDPAENSVTVPRALNVAEIAPRQTGFLHGVSLAAIVQMLHLERKTCVVEASSHGRLGSLTLVNGELVDAFAGNYLGEEAACAVLNWVDPQVSIIERADLFRHTVQRPITQLIMDAARMVDETGGLDPGKIAPSEPESLVAPNIGWQWLIESLTLAGASCVQVLTPDHSPADQSATPASTDDSADLARGIRTWASLLGSGCQRGSGYSRRSHSSSRHARRRSQRVHLRRGRRPRDSRAHSPHPSCNSAVGKFGFSVFGIRITQAFPGP